MNILIKNLNNTYNYGSMMMGENLITYLNKYTNKKINYYVEADEDVHIERLKEATQYENIFINEIKINENTSTNKIIRKIQTIFNKNTLYTNYQKKFDYVFILGGDDFSEEYYDIKTEGRYVIHLLNDLRKMNKKVPVYMIGQTIGPFTGKRKKVATKVFNSINLYTRDKKNYDYSIKELKCKPQLMHDLAFLDLNLQGQITDEIIKKYNLIKDNYITVVGTGLMHHYCDNDNMFVEKFIQIIEFLKENNPNKKIVWLSHVVGKYSSDNKMLNIIKEKYNYILDDIITIDEVLLPVEARIILGNAYYNISCRMHAAVSTFQTGKPCICLSYSPKFSGVIGQEFDMPQMIIEAKNNEYWQLDNLYLNEKIEELNSYIVKNYEDINKKIKNRIEIIKEENLRLIKTITKKLEE